MLDREERTLHVDIEDFVVQGFCRAGNRREPRYAGVGEEYIDHAGVLFDEREKRIQVGGSAHVTPQSERAFADCSSGIIQRVLIAPGDDNLSALFVKQRRRSKADSAVATGDKSDFPFE